MKDLQSVPRDLRAISGFQDRDEAYTEVIEEIIKVAEHLRELRRTEARRRQEVLRQYRQKVDETLSDGVIMPGERDTLDELRTSVGLSLDDAAAIEAEAHKPIRERAKKINQYKATLLKHIALAYPSATTSEKIWTCASATSDSRTKIPPRPRRRSSGRPRKTTTPELRPKRHRVKPGGPRGVNRPGSEPTRSQRRQRRPRRPRRQCSNRRKPRSRPDLRLNRNRSQAKHVPRTEPKAERVLAHRGRGYPGEEAAGP